MDTQSYSNHARRVPAYVATLVLLTATLGGALVNLYESIGNESRLYSAALLVALSLGTLTLAVLARRFALRAQDRAIRAEEQLRHVILTSRPLDPRLTMR